MTTAVTIPPELIAHLRLARHVVVLTGAGISAESGVPTFRDAQTGLWEQYEPEELATPQAFQRNPRLVWEWYVWRRQLVQQAQPNAGHRALANLAALVPKLTLITQNVDGLHEQAGSQQVLHLHGSIMRTKCIAHNHPVDKWPATDESPPRCPICHSYLRPDVVWFGENLPVEALHTAVQAARSCQLFLSIGTSGLVHPAASLPLEALQHRIPVVEINPTPTPLTSYADFVLPYAAGVVLPQLVQVLWERP